MQSKSMTEIQLNQLKSNYAKMVVESMDLNELITHAREAIKQDIKDWDENDTKTEILCWHDKETLERLMPE